MVVARSAFSVRVPRALPPRARDEPVPVRTGRRPARPASAPAASCTPQQRRRYLARISGPLLDRVDLRVALVRPTLADLEFGASDAEPTRRGRRPRRSRRASAPRAATPAHRGGSTPTCPARSYAGSTGSTPDAAQPLDAARVAGPGVGARGRPRRAGRVDRRRPRGPRPADAGRRRRALLHRDGGAAVGGLSDARRGPGAALARSPSPATRTWRALLAPSTARRRCVERLRGGRDADARPLPGAARRRPTRRPTSPARPGRRPAVVPGDLEWPDASSPTSAPRSPGRCGCAAPSTCGCPRCARSRSSVRAPPPPTAPTSRRGSEPTSRPRAGRSCPGGAFGIDAAAHAGALAAHGVTVAVLACGVDVAYPPRHDALFARIAADGAARLGGAARRGAPPRPVPGPQPRSSPRSPAAPSWSRRRCARGRCRRPATPSAWADRCSPCRGRSPRRCRRGVHRELRRGADPVDVRRGDRRGRRRTRRRPRRASRPGRATPRDSLDPLASRVLDGVPARRPATAESVARTAGVAAGRGGRRARAARARRARRGVARTGGCLRAVAARRVDSRAADADGGVVPTGPRCRRGGRRVTPTSGRRVPRGARARCRRR